MVYVNSNDPVLLCIKTINHYEYTRGFDFWQEDGFDGMGINLNQMIDV